MSVIKYAAMVGVVGLSGAYVSVSDHLETNAIQQQYQFTAIDMERYDVCQTALVDAGVFFEETSDANGCACIVSNIKQHIPVSDRDVAHALDALDTYATGLDYTQVQYDRALWKLAEEHNKPAAEIEQLKVKVDGVIDSCIVTS